MSKQRKPSYTHQYNLALNDTTTIQENLSRFAGAGNLDVQFYAQNFLRGSSTGAANPDLAGNSIAETTYTFTPVPEHGSGTWATELRCSKACCQARPIRPSHP
ncbi:MAG: hypothetical protein ACI8W3_002143 [Myxococcota bacterium]|jgi:hypothetical protein